MDAPIESLAPANGSFIGVWSINSPVNAAFGPTGGSFASGAWVANDALYIPVIVQAFFTVAKIAWLNGTTAAGSIDVGVYTVTGDRLVSSGAVAQSGTSTIQVADVTDTVLTPGYYYLAIAANSSSTTFLRSADLGIVGLRGMGVRWQASGYPLGATATLNDPPNNFLPSVNMMSNAVV